MSERMANTKNPKPSTEDAMATVSALIAKAKREGSIQSSELTAELEKLDLPVEKIEHIHKIILIPQSEISAVRKPL